MIEVLPSLNSLSSNPLRRLDTLGVTDFLDTLDISIDPFECAHRIWDQLDREHQELVSFLMLGGEIDLDSEVAKRSLLKGTVETIASLGLLSEHNGNASLSGLSLIRYHGIWLFADAPSPSPLLYFGSDSIGLARRLSPSPGKNALDLCSGPGIQALILAKSGMHVTAIDINPIASEICQLNALVNSISEDLTILTGSLYNALNNIESSCSYELITVNPPLLPIPEDVPYPFVGDGGPDGLNITSKVIRGAGDKLTDSGYLSAIGMIGLGTNNQSAFERIQNDLLQAGLNGVLTIISSFNLGPQSGWIDGIACTSVAHAPGKYSSKEEAVKEISRAYKKNPLRPRLHLSLEGVEGETALSKSHPNDSRLLRRWQPTWPLDPLKHPSYESRSIGCAPLSDDAQPISFPPRFTEPDSHLIVGTGFQNARFRIQNHFFCLGGRPTIFVV